jgi:hypothetical protein
LGGENWQSNMWPPEHWQTHTGRWRLATEAIDAHMRDQLRDHTISPAYDGFVVALEVADFAKWWPDSFTKPGTPASYKWKRRDVWCFARLDWLRVQHMTVEEQYGQYVGSVVEEIDRIKVAKRRPRHIDVDLLRMRIVEAFARGMPSQFTRAAFYRIGDA